MHAAFIVLCLGYILFNTGFVLWRSMSVPISTWDAIATVGFKAKVFYFEQILPPLALLPHKTYPLMTPFLESWTAFCLGYWDDVLVKIVFPCTFLSFLSIHYCFLVHFTNRTWAVLGCAVLLSSNLFLFHATISYRDFLLMYFNCTTLMLLLFWRQNPKSPLLILASLFAGFATFTKLEGTAFLGIYAVVFVLINFPSKDIPGKEKWANCMKFFIPSGAIALTYHVFKIFQQAVSDGSGIIHKTKFDFAWDKLTLIPDMVHAFFQNLFFTGNWSIVWFVLALSLIRLTERDKWKSSEIRLIFLALLLYFGLYFLTALGTVNYVWIAGAKSSTTLSRLILHFYPLSVLLIVLLNYPVTPTGKKQAP